MYTPFVYDLRTRVRFPPPPPTFAKASVGRPLGVSAEALCFCEGCPPTKSTVASAKVEAAGACEGDWRRGAFTFGGKAIRRVSRSLVFLRRLPSDEVHRSFSEGGSRRSLRRRLAKGGFHLRWAGLLACRPEPCVFAKVALRRSPP